MYNSIYPVQIKPYVPPQNKSKAAGAGEDDKESARTGVEQENISNNSNATDPHGRKGYQPQQFPNGEKATIDYSKSKVNIAQILTDFKNTAIAIGSPPNIIQEVNQYLSLAETESFKNELDKKVIQSNLKNASKILDNFISKTLNKKSKVVENWIDALFLQQVNYKSDTESINPDFLVKLPDKNTGAMRAISENLSEKSENQIAAKAAKEPAPITTQQEPEAPLAQPASSNVYIPQDPQVKKAFIQGKKFSAINDTPKAFEAFFAALSSAQAVGDKNAEGMVCFEIGQIYDKNDNLEKALNYYHQAHNASSDNNLKAKAYYSMAQIYDDVVYFEPAVEHYFAAISFAGESENLNAQTKSLSNIGDMYAEKYDVYKTHEFYGAAKNIALETKNSKTMGAIWAKSGDSMTVLNENVNALQDYKSSARFYEEAESPLKMAQNYEKAASVMVKLGNREKAKTLLEKAYKITVNTDDSDYSEKLFKRLSAF